MILLPGCNNFADNKFYIFYNECESIQLSNKTYSTFIFNFMSKAKVYTIMYMINQALFKINVRILNSEEQCN